MGQASRLPANDLQPQARRLRYRPWDGAVAPSFWFAEVDDKNITTEASSGGAYVNNLWTAAITIWADIAHRTTPFFKPHSLDIIDNTAADQNDDHFYHNLFVGPKGLSAYDEFKLQIKASGNVYLNGACPSACDTDAVVAGDAGRSGLDDRAQGPGGELRPSRQGLHLRRPLLEPRWNSSLDRHRFLRLRMCRIQLCPGPFAWDGKSTIRAKVWPKN